MEKDGKIEVNGGECRTLNGVDMRRKIMCVSGRLT